MYNLSERILLAESSARTRHSLLRPMGWLLGASTRVAGRLGAWAYWTTWPVEIGQTIAFGGRWNLTRTGWKLRPGVLLGTWKKL